MSLYCNECKAPISSDVYTYSLNKFQRPLCLNHQKKVPVSKANREISKPEPTPEQKALHSALKRRGVPAKLEKWDGHKHIDIAVVSSRVNIEVDGKQHLEKKQALADLKRTFHSFRKGFVTLRIPNELVREKESLEETADYLAAFLNESEDQLDREVEEEY